MAKNNNEDFMGCGRLGYKDIKLIDIQPLHPGMTVMVVDTDADDNVVMRDCVETGNCYCLALVEENGENAVYPFALSTFYGVDLRATVVPIRHCPKCGKRMRPHMEEGDTGTLYYTCGRCGRMEQSWLEPDELEEPGETDVNCKEDKDHEQDYHL